MIESQVPSELFVIIKEIWSKAILQWNNMLGDSLENLRHGLSKKDITELVESCIRNKNT